MLWLWNRLTSHAFYVLDDVALTEKLAVVAGRRNVGDTVTSGTAAQILDLREIR